MDAQDKLRLAVIIVCYHSNSILRSCISSLDTAIAAIPTEDRPEVELVLIANSPEDDIESIETRECRTTCLHAPGNIGFSPAVNLGLDAVPHADFILLLNPDAQVADDCLAVMLSEARSQGAALVGPTLCDAEKQPHGVSERPFHSVRREFATQLLGAERKRSPYGEQAYRTGSARCLTGACLLIDGAFLRSVGGLDTEVHMYLEDVMLCWHAHEQRRPVLLATQAECQHALGGSSGGNDFRSSIGLYLTMLGARVEFVRRRSGFKGAFAMRAIMALGAMIRCALLTGERRRKQLATLYWAITSGASPEWLDGPKVDLPAFVRRVGS
jgi:GT2 family glycosyltransferase